MARKPRLHVPGGLYHVILRGNARQDVFISAGDRQAFYDLLAEGVTRFGYRVHAFCLMINHLHLALQAGESGLSSGMQNLSFRYTRYLNTRLARVGHVFQGRFKAFLVDQDHYGLALVRYLHLNPVRAKMVREAGAYRWSSQRAYLGDETLPWLTTDWVLGQFGQRTAMARTRFAAFVDSGKAEGHSALYYGGQDDSRVVGEEDFVRKVLPRKRQGPRPPSLSAILEYVCRGASMREADLLAPGKARAPAQARALAGWLALKSQAATLTRVAAHFDRDLSTLSHAVAALEKRSRNSESFAIALNEHLYTIYQA
ncbi:MAG: transposase [Burkholderiales bacterium]